MKRFFSFFLSFVLVFSMIPAIPVSAVGFHETPVIEYTDTSAVSSWTSHFASLISSLDVLSDYSSALMWEALDLSLEGVIPGEKDSVREVVSSVSGLNSFWSRALDFVLDRVLPNYAKDSLSLDAGIGFDDARGVYRPYDRKTGLPIVNSIGQFPYYKPSVADPDTGEEVPDRSLGGKWVRVDKVNWNRVNILSEYSFYDIGYALRDYGEDNEVDVRYVDGDPVYEYLVSRDRFENGIPFVYCDKDGQPYVNRPDPDAWAQEQDNNWIIDDDGNTENGQLIDVDTSTIWFPDGTLNFINNLVYDESQKTYYVDASSSYDIDNNYYYTYNYHYEYHIDHTSITYIGQTAEYDEVYEYYYQLPDGRSSADLTAEELQALNTQIDVLPYIRSADDTSIRALYHFDGDTRDSSYWSYLGHFDWQKGASITYMDSGAFNGALYLDENEHKFSFTLPSAVGTGDLTLQFRYYQSATPAPVCDSRVTIGEKFVLRFNGQSICDGSGNALAPLSIGNWQDICIMRENGTVYVYHNGVVIATFPNVTVALPDVVSFEWGSEQQTYKYFDEFRFVTEAVYPAEGYTPSSVPFDTNLALVLPDSQLPVADEYWKYEYSSAPMVEQVFSGTTNINGVVNQTCYPVPYRKLYYHTSYGSVEMNNGFLRYKANSRDYNSAGGSWEHWQHMLLFPRFSLSYLVSYFDAVDSRYSANAVGNTLTQVSTPVSHCDLNQHYLHGRSFTAVLVTTDGEVCTLPFSVQFRSASDTDAVVHASKTFDWGTMAAISYYYSGWDSRSFVVSLAPMANTPLDIIYFGIFDGNVTFSAEKVTGVTVMDKDDLNTPSLAVRTDLDITGYQIGGVRPSLPEKGLVWALVEAGRISSLQIYNGQAWEEVDGRIWTGSRWVPYYAYDVLLLKDMYDIVESDPSLNPIYTETGFWKWLQGAWGEMMDKLDQIAAGSGGSGSGSGETKSFWNRIVDAFTSGLTALIEGVFTLIIEILKTLLSLVTDLLSFLFSFVGETVLGGISDFFSAFTDGTLFEGFQQTDEDGNTTTQLPEGVGAVFADFSGMFSALPAELLGVLVFGIGLLFFLAVIKLF